MAEEFINEIYSKSELIYIYRQCSELLTIRDMSKFAKLWSAYSVKILDVIEELKHTDENLGIRLQNLAYGVMSNIRNPLLVKELLDGGIIPILYQYIDKYCGIDVTEGEWQLKSSRSGFLTMYNKKLACHIHGLDNPMWQAREEAKVVYDGKYDRALLFGAGLGYMARALWELSEGSLDIYVFERDKCLEEYAHNYGVVDAIDEDRLHYIVNDDIIELYGEYLQMQIGEESNLTIMQEWMAEYLEEPIKSDVKTLIMSENALLSFRDNYNINFWRNKKKFTGEFSELADKHKGSDFIVVAAGPSLDDNMQYIKDNAGKKIIVCVNTVLRRLLKEGIKPDYLCLLDPTVGVYAHVDGLADKTEDIPLIAESVSYWKFLDVYKGPIYRIFGASFNESIEEAERIKEPITDIGSSVSNLVIEAAVKMGAKHIEMVGMDLAFPGDKQYAGDKNNYRNNQLQDDLFVRATDGQTVRTVDTFNIFRSDIEKQIFRNSDIEFENLSPHGALINGSYNGGWRDYRLSVLINDRSNISDNNYQVLSNIGGLISCIDAGNKEYKNILQNAKFEKLNNEAEKALIFNVLMKWHEYAEIINDISAILYLDSAMLSIEYDEGIATEFIKRIASAPIDYKGRYFWYCQIADKFRTGAFERSDILEAFLTMLKESITDEVSMLIDLEKKDDKTEGNESNTCLVITDELKSEDIENGTEALTVAEEAIKKGMQVLLVNTAERFPFGEFMPIYSEVFRSNEDDWVSNESIRFHERIIPYFQCESCMPDLGNIKLLLEYIQKVSPSEIVSLTEDSIVVWLIKKLL